MNARSTRTHDALTGLPHCHDFLLDLQAATEAASPPHALIVIEPRVRHAATLAQRAKRLVTIGRVLALASGRASVTRLDARRFAVLLGSCDLAAAATVAERLCTALDVYFNRDTSAVSACAGVATTPDRFDGPVEALIDLATWRCEFARHGGVPVCAGGSPSGEWPQSWLQWPSLAQTLEWPAN